MLAHWGGTYFFSFPLPTYRKQQQQLSPYGNSEGTCHLIVLSGGKRFESWCNDGLGSVALVNVWVAPVVCPEKLLTPGRNYWLHFNFIIILYGAVCFISASASSETRSCGKSCCRWFYFLEEGGETHTWLLVTLTVTGYYRRRGFAHSFARFTCVEICFFFSKWACLNVFFMQLAWHRSDGQ